MDGEIDLMSKKLTQDYLKSILDYDKDTGVFTWKNRCDVQQRINSRLVGTVAGSLRNDYLVIAIFRKKYPAHHLAWLYVYGEFPKLLLDHFDMNPKNNRISNLRLATRAQNGMNRLKQPNNTSGWKGVSRRRGRKWWEAKIMVRGNSIHLGNFNCPTAAYISYCKAAKELHGEFARF